MKTQTLFLSVLLAIVPALLGTSCAKENPSSVDDAGTQALVTPKMLAQVLGSVDLGIDRCAEVHDAVCSSTSNGYDEEYTMQNLFESPGTGVGDDAQAKASAKSYSRPLRDLIAAHFAKAGKDNFIGDNFAGASWSGFAGVDLEGTSGSGLASTGSKAGEDAPSGQEYVDYIASSDMQIYWPNSENWDGETSPVVTYLPDGEQSSNTGWYVDADGQVCEMTVNEQTAAERPVWVLNRNEDAGYTTLEQYLRENPGRNGGDIVVKAGTMMQPKASSAAGVVKELMGAVADIPGPMRAAADDGQIKTLVLKSFTMKRHYDSWFRGASEFFIKMGAVESFLAKNEEDLSLYNPKITDFMVVIKRKWLNVPYELNTILVSDWTEQLENVAFMIIEDDGGSRTSWKCSAVVKYNSKSFGFDIDLPYRSNDDIVWRGQLSRRFIEASTQVTGRFGDVELVFNFL